jgi:hypothetical protein
MIREARMYKILGSDGFEYGPIAAEKIKQWIQEDRVDQKTPVMPDGAEDWVFLGSLPEFAEDFTSQQKLETVAPVKNRRGWTAVYFGLLLLVVTAAIALFILKNMKHH